MSCRHWWLAWGKWNATWRSVYKLFYWHLSAVETLIERLHEMFIHVYFELKVIVKRKEWSCSLALRAAIRTDPIYTTHVCGALRPQQFFFFEAVQKCLSDALYSDLSHHIKDCQNGIYSFNFLGKNWQLERWIFTSAVVKTIQYLFGTHEYQTERPVLKIFGANTCTVTPLKDTLIKILNLAT